MKKDFVIVRIIDGGIDNIKGIVNLFVGVPDGKYIVERSRYNKRSNQQNRYYFGLVIPLVKKGIADLGTELTTEETHEFLKARFNYTELVNEDTAEVLQLPRSTAALSKVEFMEYIERIQVFASQFLNIVIPDPGEQMEMNY